MRVKRSKVGSNHKVVFLGCGAVGKCCIHYLQRFVNVSFSQVFIVDKDEETTYFPTVVQALNQGATFIKFDINRKNIQDLLDNILKLHKHDVVVDVTTCTSTYVILKECRMRNILYMNTSIEDDSPLNTDFNCPINNGIFMQHVNLQCIADKTVENGNTTSLIEFGMNPGLISVFAKQGILDIAKKAIKSNPDAKLMKWYKTQNVRKLAQFLDIRAIHCSEIDTQISLKNNKYKFANTWSCVGLITEGIEPAEIQIGTHEHRLPFSKQNVVQIVPQLVTTKTPGQNITFNSIVPLKVTRAGKVIFTEIEGRCIHHGEGISLNRLLGTFKYAPTMHYVYKLNPLTDSMLNAYSTNELIDISKNPKDWKVLDMYNDHLHGYDNVGAFFILGRNPITNEKTPYGFWTGSILDTGYTTKSLKDVYFGPTIIQVMAGVLSGLCWMLDNRHKGLCFGESVQNAYILERAQMYLGHYYSGPVGIPPKATKLVNLIVKGADDKATFVDTNEL